MDIITIGVLAATSIANTVAHSVTISEEKKISSRVAKLEATAKSYRKELFALETTTAVSGLLSVVDNIIWKREFSKFKKHMEEKDKNIRDSFSDMSARIDNLAVAIANKPPIVTISPQEQKEE